MGEPPAPGGGGPPKSMPGRGEPVKFIPGGEGPPKPCGEEPPEEPGSDMQVLV